MYHKPHPLLAPSPHKLSHVPAFRLEVWTGNVFSRHCKTAPLRAAQPRVQQFVAFQRVSPSTFLAYGIFSSLPSCSHFLHASEEKTPQAFLSTIRPHQVHAHLAHQLPQSSLPFGFPALTRMQMCKTMATTPCQPQQGTEAQQDAVPPLPDILSSPTRRMCGQCWSVLIKKGFVTPTTMFGLVRRERAQKDVTLRASSRHTAASGQRGAVSYSRGLCPGGVFLKFTVMDREIGAVVAAVPQGSQAAVTTDRRAAIEAS